MSNQFTAEQMKELKKMFDEFDADGGGTISEEELTQVFRSLGEEPEKEAIQDMMGEVDDSGDLCISWLEFVELMAEQIKDNETKRALDKAFKTFDRNGDGYINAEEFRYLMMNVGHKLSREDADELMKDAVGRDGQLNIKDFVELMSAEVYT